MDKNFRDFQEKGGISDQQAFLIIRLTQMSQLSNSNYYFRNAI